GFILAFAGIGLAAFIGVAVILFGGFPNLLSSIPAYTYSFTVLLSYGVFFLFAAATVLSFVMMTARIFLQPDGLIISK
ncbi:MAG: hypothetical protein SCK28_09830, partial [Bacillota bacterium]|nr:hypothetical protein [Bacillota bacterium]